MLTVDADKAPPYLALSYTWGSPVFEDQALVNGKSIGITKNLGDALRGVRSYVSQKSLMIWADSICTYSDRSRIKPFRNLKCLFPRFDERPQKSEDSTTYFRGFDLILENAIALLRPGTLNLWKMEYHTTRVVFETLYNL